MEKKYSQEDLDYLISQKKARIGFFKGALAHFTYFARIFLRLLSLKNIAKMENSMSDTLSKTDRNQITHYDK